MFVGCLPAMRYSLSQLWGRSCSDKSGTICVLEVTFKIQKEVVPDLCEHDYIGIRYKNLVFNVQSMDK
jgi:hypothetical protein